MVTARFHVEVAESSDTRYAFTVVVIVAKPKAITFDLIGLSLPHVRNPSLSG
jgi:hypothetical protein